MRVSHLEQVLPMPRPLAMANYGLACRGHQQEHQHVHSSHQLGWVSQWLSPAAAGIRNIIFSFKSVQLRWVHREEVKTVLLMISSGRRILSEICWTSITLRVQFPGESMQFPIRPHVCAQQKELNLFSMPIGMRTLSDLKVCIPFTLHIYASYDNVVFS